MIKHPWTVSGTALAAAAGLLAMACAASAAPARVTGNVNLRAGPGTQYQRIMTMQAGAPVEVYGCLSGYSWCDISYGPERGWVSSRYLSIFYNDRIYVPSRPVVTVPFLSFNFGYWDRHYRERPWYSHRPPRYDGDYPRPPRWDNDRPPHNWGHRPGDRPDHKPDRLRDERIPPRWQDERPHGDNRPDRHRNDRQDNDRPRGERIMPGQPHPWSAMPDRPRRPEHARPERPNRDRPDRPPQVRHPRPEPQHSDRHPDRRPQAQGNRPDRDRHQGNNRPDRGNRPHVCPPGQDCR